MKKLIIDPVLDNKWNHEIAKYFEKTVDVDLVLGLGRGGLGLAATIHEYQDNAQIEYINISSYKGTEQHRLVYNPDVIDMQLAHIMGDRLNTHGLNIVICDGIIDTGTTINEVARIVTDHFYNVNIFLACKATNVSDNNLVGDYPIVNAAIKDSDTWVVQTYERQDD